MSAKKRARKTTKTTVADKQRPIFHCKGELDAEIEDPNRILAKKPGIKILSTARRVAAR